MSKSKVQTCTSDSLLKIKTLGESADFGVCRMSSNEGVHA